MTFFHALRQSVLPHKRIHMIEPKILILSRFLVSDVTYVTHHPPRACQGDVWSLGCALYKWTTGKEFAHVASGASFQKALDVVPPSWGSKVIQYLHVEARLHFQVYLWGSTTV